jgi:hypothetical protein
MQKINKKWINSLENTSQTTNSYSIEANKTRTEEFYILVYDAM